jgi:hypothetical protein
MPTDTLLTGVLCRPTGQSAGGGARCRRLSGRWSTGRHAYTAENPTTEIDKYYAKYQDLYGISTNDLRQLAQTALHELHAETRRRNQEQTPKQKHQMRKAGRSAGRCRACAATATATAGLATSGRSSRVNDATRPDWRPQTYGRRDGSQPRGRAS